MIQIKNNHQLSFLSIVGSQAYGLNLDNSDTDVKGFCYPNKSSLYGIHPFEQFESRECLKDSQLGSLYDNDPTGDTTVYALGKFIKLCLENNPSIVELLAVPEKFILYSDSTYDELRDNIDKIICKSAKYRFAGYAHAQFKRIQTHRNWLLNPPKKKPERADFNLPEVQDLSGYKAVKAQLEKIVNMNDLDAMELTNEQKYFIRDVVERRLGWDCFRKDFVGDFSVGVMQEYTISNDYMNYFIQESAFQNAQRSYSDYLNWTKTRNPKRQALEAKCGYDSKHASHCLRLLRMGIEIMQGKGIIVYREDDREELIDLKVGNWSYDEFHEKFQKETEQLDLLYETSSLPHKPNYKFFDNWLLEKYEAYSKGL